MKVTAIIAEYNPFHKGHEYNIAEAKRMTEADFIVVIMSGNFVQRGTPAICDKYLRTSMALSGGADVVFELPAAFATCSAEIFAEGAIKALSGLNSIDYICFGSESGDIDSIFSIAKLLNSEPEYYIKALKGYMKSGNSYPKARMLALSDYIASDTAVIFPKNEELVSLPNNILGIEYCRALLRLSEKYDQPVPKPLTIKRLGSGYHTDELSDISFASAEAIRETIQNNGISKRLLEACSEAVANLLEASYHVKFPVSVDDLSILLKYKLIYSSQNNLSVCQDVSNDLLNSIFNLSDSARSFTDTINILKTKCITFTSISRALLHIILDIRAEYINELRINQYLPYLRLLGMKHTASPLLRQIQNKSSMRIITKLADADTNNSLLRCDINASHLYNQILLTKFGYISRNEFEHKPVIFYK